MKADSRRRLTDYIKQDAAYTRYKENPNQKFNDVDQVCIEHCKDIEELLKENKHLSELCNPQTTIVKQKQV